MPRSKVESESILPDGSGLPFVLSIAASNFCSCKWLIQEAPEAKRNTPKVGRIIPRSIFPENKI